MIEMLDIYDGESLARDADNRPSLLHMPDLAARWCERSHGYLSVFPSTSTSSRASTSPSSSCRCPIVFSSQAADPMEGSPGLLGYFSNETVFTENLFVKLGEPDPWSGYKQRGVDVGSPSVVHHRYLSLQRAFTLLTTVPSRECSCDYSFNSSADTPFIQGNERFCPPLIVLLRAITNSLGRCGVYRRFRSAYVEEGPLKRKLYLSSNPCARSAFLKHACHLL